MNLRDLRYLVAVAEHRHFGRAAEACYVSQPTLSTQIKKLERDLGVELIERNPRQVLLTAAGEQVVERARVILGEADTIRNIAKRAQDPEAGSIRMGLFPTLAPYLLPHVVPELHARFPRLELLLGRFALTFSLRAHGVVTNAARTRATGPLFSGAEESLRRAPLPRFQTYLLGSAGLLYRF